MFGTAIRVGVGWAGTMLMISVLETVAEPHILPRLQDGGLLYRSIAGTTTWLPLIVTVAALMALIARGLAESEVA